MKESLAFQMLLSGRRSLLPHAMQLLPTTTSLPWNMLGLTPLHAAAVRGDLAAIRMLIEVGCGVDDVSGAGAEEDTRQWTALTYAAMAGQVKV